MKTSNSNRIALVLIGVMATMLSGFIAMRLFVLDWYHFPSSSMLPTVWPGNILIVNKLAGNDAKRGELVALNISGDKGSVIYVKRLVGIGGDSISLVGEKLSVNGQHAQYEFSRRMTENNLSYQVFAESIFTQSYEIAQLDRPGSEDFEAIVPDGHLFFLGDNRRNSRDSRFADVGAISTNGVVGVVTHIFGVNGHGQ